MKSHSNGWTTILTEGDLEHLVTRRKVILLARKAEITKNGIGIMSTKQFILEAVPFIIKKRYELAVIRLTPSKGVVVKIDNKETIIQQDTIERFCQWVVGNGHRYFKMIVGGKDVTEFFVYYFSNSPNYSKDASLLWDCHDSNAEAMYVYNEKYPNSDESLNDIVSFMLKKKRG